MGLSRKVAFPDNGCWNASSHDLVVDHSHLGEQTPGKFGGILVWRSLCSVLFDLHRNRSFDLTDAAFRLGLVASDYLEFGTVNPLDLMIAETKLTVGWPLYLQEIQALRIDKQLKSETDNPNSQFTPNYHGVAHFIRGIVCALYFQAMLISMMEAPETSWMVGSVLTAGALIRVGYHRKVVREAGPSVNGQKFADGVFGLSALLVPTISYNDTQIIRYHSLGLFDQTLERAPKRMTVREPVSRPVSERIGHICADGAPVELSYTNITYFKSNADSDFFYSNRTILPTILGVFNREKKTLLVPPQWVVPLSFCDLNLTVGYVGICGIADGINRVPTSIDVHRISKIYAGMPELSDIERRVFKGDQALSGIHHDVMKRRYGSHQF